jgi:flagellar FliJ protein
MRRFNFKLENVLKYRVTRENLAKNAYQEALRILNAEKDHLINLENTKTELMQAYNIKAGTVVHPDTLIFIARYTSQLLQLIERQKHIIMENEQRVKETFDEWNQKRRDVKVIERLKEKKWQAYLREADKEDQKFHDVIFIAKKIREREAAP